MKPRLLSDPFDSADGSNFFDAFGEALGQAWHFTPSPSQAWLLSAIGASAEPASSLDAPVEVPYTPALVSEAVEALGAQSGPTTVTSMTTGGITINLLFDAAAMAAPASFRAGIQQAASLLTAAISDQITVNIKIDYSGTGGGAAAGPDAGLYESYSFVRSNLINHATAGDTAFNALPSGTSIQGQTNVAVWNAQLKLWGVLGATDTTTDDGSATFATDINSNLLVGVALHELTHAMGRVPYGSPYSSSPDIFDLFRFTSPGVRLFDGSSTAAPAYFSLDGGSTNLADFGQYSDPSDFLNSGVQGSTDPFNEYYGGGTLQSLTTVDKQILDALGFHTASKAIFVTGTSSQAIQGGSAVKLLSTQPTIAGTSTTLSSATIKITNASGGAIVGDLLSVNGTQNGVVATGVTASWNVSADTLTLSGNASIATYDALLGQISYQDTGTDVSMGSHPVRTVTWSVNDGSSTFYNTSQIAIERAPVAITSNVVLNANVSMVAASSLCVAYDPDADSLVTYGFINSGTGYFLLNGVAQANNQEIDVSSAQLSQLTYQSVGATDTLQLRVNDGMLWSGWHTFTVRGPTPVVVQTDLTTSLVLIGTNYFLNPVGGGIGPELKYNGAPLYSGEFGSWTLIGAVQVSGGYDIAWKFPTGVYAVSSVDSNGNYINDIFSGVPANSTVLEQYETTFNQDLNGDGTVGIPTIVIHNDGTTSLVQVGNNYFFNAVGSGVTGPEFKYNGAPVYTGEFGSWTLIGAVQVSGGYDIAWKFPTGIYAVSSVDSNGNYINDIFSGVAANSTILEQYETTFNQDLNGDGTVGIPTTVIHNDGTTSLIQVGTNYFLNPVGGGIGPELKYNGAPLYSGEFGSWTLIGAVQVSGGYDIAWKFPTGVYAVSSVDSNGNYINDIFSGVPANSTVLEQYETTFNQDLNGDGTVGIPTIVIHNDGTTSLVQVGNNYFFNAVGSGVTGPEFKYNGAPVYTGEFGSWTLIGAVQVSGGYDIAWKFPTGIYAVSSVDSNGNYINDIFSGVAANSTILEQYETTFNQDLNGDGTVGIPTTVIHNDGTTSLIQVGTNYFLNPVSGGTGPELKYNGTPLYSGEFGSWTLIGAVHVSGGYDIAWKFPTGVYAVSSVDSNGNYINDIFSGVAANSTVLEQYETTFNQDLNGDGTVGIPSATALASPQADLVLTRSYSFDSRIPILDPPMLNGPIIGFRGDGTVSGSDQIDLKGINSNSLYSSFDSTTGVLIVGDGTITAKLEFSGQYSPENFHFANDGFGGTTVYTSGPPSLSSQPVVVTMSGHDGFVFNPNFGQLIITNFDPVSDNIYFGKSVLADIDALIAATHDDLSGNAVVTDALHDTLTIQHTTTAQLLAQQSNFHFF
ncbi:NF038122 family metalloprotease [Bradyrhizobium sp. McL0615]|uniref:NF038122 family metalloprotease n=1 Tax=Bradyrhizobium sp. McL0615 TaxID=3415673 RepID=UPI003CF0136A